MPLLIRTANIAPVISPLSSKSAILINALSVKLRLNPLSIYFFPAKYPLIFGNTSCLCCETTILLLRIEKKRI